MEENIIPKKSKSPGKKRSKNFSLLDFDFRMSMRTKKLRQEQMKYDKIIDELSNEISKKLSYGIDESSMKLSTDENLQDVVRYILKKESKNKYHVIIIRYYLFQFPALLETMNLSLHYYETREIINKIAIHLKKEEVPKDNVVFYNGQIGKAFYIILEGEVSVLIPSEYSADITMDKYLQYLKFLYELNDYELLRLSYESNKNLLEKYDYEVESELKHFDYGFDKVITNNTKKEEIDVQSYIDRFLFMEKEEYKSESSNEIKIDFENINNNPEEEENSKNITNNFNSINDDEIYSNKEEDSKDPNKPNISKISNTSNYSIVQKNIDNHDEIEKKYIKKKTKHNFSLWKYVEIIKLGKGKSFGEIALQSSKSKRTATIIALTDCFFGILEKDEYLLFVKETIEKMRRNNIERLLNTRLFEGITFINFETRYFNCFTFSKENKGTYLFKRGDTRNNMIYIKKGEVQLEIIASCKQLDNIILSIGGNPYDPFLNNLIKKNKKINEFINNPKKFNISIFSQGDIIGTDELVYISSNEFNKEKIPDKEYISNILNNTKLEENCFLFNGIYLTGSEVFKLELHFLASMLKDKTIKTNYEKLKKDKKERLIERLLNIRYNTIMNFYNLINESKDNINIMKNKRKNYSFSLNKKTIINSKHFLSMKNFNIRNTKITNNNANNNKINTTINTRNNSFLDDISKNKGKTKDFFYPEPDAQKRNEKKEIQKRSLLASFMNNNNYNYKGKLTKKIFLSGNNTLQKFNSEKIMPINKNKTYYNANTYFDLKKMSISKNKNIWRNLNANLSNNNTIYNNEDNLSKNNSSDKMSTYKSFYKIKNPKKLKLSDALMNSFKDPKIKMIKNQKIPKFLMKNALIYNTVIDKIFLKKNKNIFNNPILSTNKDNNDNNDNNPINSIDKYNEDNNKIFNTLDVLAFDDILNNIKKNKIINTKKFLPILENSKKPKKFNNNIFPRTGYNFLMKKSK